VRRVAVLVPVYRPCLDLDELTSLRHLNRFLARYDRYLVKPRSLDLELDGFRSARFPDGFFRSTRTYTSLCLSRAFYRRFLAYDYVLVHQLDCLVFADELEDWCAKGYDYVGGVHEIAGVRMVGNGGFSLRRVRAALAVLESKVRMTDPRDHWARYWAHRSAATRLAATPRRWLKHLRRFNGVDWQIRKHMTSGYGWGEDWFWSIDASKYLPSFSRPPNEEADLFAFFGEPRETYESVGRRLPFGCHGWTRFDRAFWEPFLIRD